MDKKLLDKFFKGQCSPEQVDEILTSYYSGELSDDVAEVLRKYLKNPHLAEKEVSWDSKGLFDKITDEIHGERVATNKHINRSTKAKKELKFYPFWFRVAASISVLLVISFFLIRQPFIPEEVTSPKEATNFVIKSTSPSERLTVRLNDGSQVILNTDSKITYRKEFEPHQRVISLEGEAFFVVEKDKKRPFSVEANGIITTALGTSFNVNTNMEKEGEVEIALVEGEVKVHNENVISGSENNTLFLKSGEKLAIGTDGLRRTKLNVKETVGWKDGIIYFESVPFATVMHTLEKNYDVQFVVGYKNKEQRHQRYSGEFKNKSLEYILKNLSFSSDFTFEINGNNVKIIFK